MTQVFPSEPEENQTPTSNEGSEQPSSTERPTVLSGAYPFGSGETENKPSESWEEPVPPTASESYSTSHEEKKMADTYPAPPPPPQIVEPGGEPAKKNNRTIWIIVIVAVLLLCCCCVVVAVLVATSQNFDMNNLDFSSLFSMARLI
jgi:hypothetical protein